MACSIKFSSVVHANFVNYVPDDIFSVGSTSPNSFLSRLGLTLVRCVLSSAVWPNPPQKWHVLATFSNSWSITASCGYVEPQLKSEKHISERGLDAGASGSNS